jgi:hypothetical protein
MANNLECQLRGKLIFPVRVTPISSHAQFNICVDPHRPASKNPQSLRRSQIGGIGTAYTGDTSKFDADMGQGASLVSLTGVFLADN